MSDIPMDSIVTSLKDDQLAHLATGLEHAFGCTIRKKGPYLWLGMVEFEGGMLIGPQRTVQDMWEGSQAMAQARDEYSSGVN